MPSDTNNRALALLVGYRWLSLLPPLVFLLLDRQPTALEVGIFLVAAALNGLVLAMGRRLNRMLRRVPTLLGLELVLMAALLALTGGPRSPYSMLALAPLLAGAFFFRLRGALLTATAFAPLYVGAVRLLEQPGAPDWIAVWLHVAGMYVLAATFGYASRLFAQLERARDVTTQSHRDLEVIHDLTVLLQQAPDVNEVEERVLEAVTTDLGFKRAVVALVDQDEGVITAWLGRARNGRPMLDGGLPHPARIPLAPHGGLLAKALLTGQVHLNVEAPWTSNQYLNAHLRMEACHIFPLQLREHPVGVLLVDATGAADESARLKSLESIASQAAVAIGATLLCIDRAQRLAVQEERIRIAHEIHDTVSQTLFGMSYTLNACTKMLPEQPQKVRDELARLTELAESARGQLRQSILDIWPSQITAESFISDLRKYVREHCQSDQLDIDIRLGGDFQRLSSGARRSLYRIAQEATANITHHAAASRASICLDVGSEEVMMAIRDNGRGFDPALALARERNREHFGLRGIVERVQSFGGACEFASRPGAGTTVLVTIPLEN